MLTYKFTPFKWWVHYLTQFHESIKSKYCAKVIIWRFRHFLVPELLNQSHDMNSHYRGQNVERKCHDFFHFCLSTFCVEQTCILSKNTCILSRDYARTITLTFCFIFPTKVGSIVAKIFIERCILTINFEFKIQLDVHELGFPDKNVLFTLRRFHSCAIISPLICCLQDSTYKLFSSHWLEKCG